MEYTVSKKADKKIDSDMKLIVAEIKNHIPNLISIFLTGGFSRGEGPVKVEGKEILLYNDYDIQIISKNKVSKQNIDKIAHIISKKLGYGSISSFYNFNKENQDIKNNFYIDLKCDTLGDMKKFLPRIRNYELKNTSRLIYGTDTRHLISNYKINNIPLSDAAKLLLDRMSQMIEYYSRENKHDKEFLTYIIQQAYAACCTSLLMLTKKYQIGYGNAMDIFKENYKKDFQELYSKIPNLDKKIETFIKWKINPDKPQFKDIEEEWFICKNNLIEVSKYFFSKFLNKNLQTTGELSNAILNMEEEFYLPYLDSMMHNKLKIKSRLISKALLPLVKFILKQKYKSRLNEMNINDFNIKSKESPDLVIFSSLIFIIASINEKEVDTNLFNKGKKILNQVYPSKSENWEGLSLEYANAYIAFFLQKI